jgi:hypothetical protein
MLAQLQSAFERARGNVARVQQLLADEHALNVSYSTLTRWVRQAGLRTPPQRAGEYSFALGEEMQHDTSPHRVSIGGRLVTAQCAALVLAYSRRLFALYFPRYSRFEAKHLSARGGPLHGRHRAALRDRQYQCDDRRRGRPERRDRPGDGRVRPHLGL